MKARRFLNLMMASLVAMAYTSCSSSDDVIDTPDPIVKSYTMTVDAQKGSNGTRALSLDGTTLNSTWTEGDAVDVYKGENKIGTLTAQSTGANTSLKGTLSGDLNVNDNLTLKYLSPDYDSQNGTIASISANCDYSTATVTVSGIAGGNISTTNANFVNQQAVIKFTLKNADGSASLGNPTAFSVTDGTSTVTLSDIPAETYTTNGGTGVLYVAFPASGASATITLSATVSGEVYGLAKTDITFTNSNYYGVTVKMKEIPVLNGKFTVDNKSGDKVVVQFSKGNLQATYDGSSWTWKFADHQYDYVGNAAANTAINGNGTVSTNGTVDLFGWSTSSTYLGIHNSTSNLYSGAFVDWGSHSDVIAGIGTGWRTLTQAEWTYLFNTRTVNGGTGAGHSYTLGQSVNGKLGVVIYPDNYTGEVYSGSDWATFEAAGCVFLPAAGYRDGSSVNSVGSRGYYWSSTANGTNYAYNVSFYSGNVRPANDDYRYYGFSVRLVRPE